MKIVIPTLNPNSERTLQCVRAAAKSIRNTDSGPENAEIVMVIPPDAEEMKQPPYPITYARCTPGDSYSRLNNIGVKAGRDDWQAVVFLNDDCFIRTTCIGRMAQALQTVEDVGVVGAKLLFADGRVQHIGVHIRTHGGPIHYGYGKVDDGSFEPARRSEYVTAVTWACSMVSRECWDAVGQMDEDYYFNFEDTDFCLNALEKGFRSYFVHTAVGLHEEGASSEHRNTHKHTVARNFKILYDKWIATGKLAKMALVDMKQVGNPHRMNVAFLLMRKGIGVPWWRLELPASEMQRQQLANVSVLDVSSTDPTAILLVAEAADIMVISGATDETTLRVAKDHSRPFRLVYDYDDHPIHISPYAGAYRWFGITEVRVADAATGKEHWLWRDGQDGFDVERNRQARSRQLEIMSHCDLVTTTVPGLAAYFKTFCKNVRVLPNMIPLRVYRDPLRRGWRRKPGKLRIGWHGGDNHWHDIASISEPLKRFINSRDDVELVLFGAYYKGPLKGIDPNKVVEEEWVHVEAFPYKLAMLGIDIAVVPLADPNLPYMRFNETKSDIKVLEYAAVGVPSLVASQTPYSDWKDDVDCLKYTTPEDFYEKLTLLAGDEALRTRLMIAAAKHAEDRSMEKNIGRWVEMYEEIASQTPVISDDTLLGPYQPGHAKPAAEVVEVPDEDLRPAASNAKPEGGAA